jgi:hypothetical protein
MVTGIPPELRSDRKLAEYFESLGLGVVESVHVVKHVSQLSELIRERARCLRKLETAYAQYWGNPCNDPAYDPDALLMLAEQSDHINAIDFSVQQSERDRLPLFKPRRSRPTVRDGMLGITGKKVDAIEYYSEQFNYLDDIVMKARRLGRYPPSTVGFVTFENVISAVSQVKGRRFVRNSTEQCLLYTRQLLFKLYCTLAHSWCVRKQPQNLAISCGIMLPYGAVRD